MTMRPWHVAVLLLVLTATPAAADDIFDDEADTPLPAEAVEAEAAAMAAEEARVAAAERAAAERAAPKPQQAAAADIAKQQAPTRPAGPTLGVYEYAGLAFIVLFGLNYLYGRQANEKRASKWADAVYELLETQFASVGEDDAVMIKESPDTFLIDATGRERIEWLQAKLKLSSRQDLYMVLMGLVSPKPDKLVLDLCIPEGEGDAFVLAVFDRTIDGSHVQDLQDLKTLASPCALSELALPDSVRALCEQREIAAQLLGGEVAQLLAAHPAAFEQLHYTDYVPRAWGLPSETKRALHLVFRLPAGGAAAAAEATKPLLRLALLLADRIGRLRLTPALKEKVKKGRASLEALKFKEGYKEREEAAQQRKAERLAKQREEKKPLASREAQRKREEKEARQAAKKKGPGMKVKKV
jgi:hypothetical protein